MGVTESRRKAIEDIRFEFIRWSCDEVENDAQARKLSLVGWLVGWLASVCSCMLACVCEGRLTEWLAGWLFDRQIKSRQCIAPMKGRALMTSRGNT